MWTIPIMAILGLVGVQTPVAHATDETGSTVRFYQCQIEPRENENFSLADVECWLPPANERISGILCIVLHPHGDGGVRFDNPQPWIALAGKYHCALLSISFISQDLDMIPWCHASMGTGRALLAAVDEIAEKSCVTALRKSPLVLAGICGAGQFAYEFSAYAPNRTGAFFTMGGSMHDLDLAGKAAAVPGLLVAATDHGEDPINNMFALFACGRRYSAPWNFSAEPMGDYDKGHSSPLASIFIGKALERLYAESEDAIDPNIKSNLLLPLREAAFATGNFSNNIAGTMAAIHASSLNCAFLDQETAEAWVGHIGTNRVPDLSFVSVPLPESGTVSPSTLDMGTMSPKSGAGAGFFDVQCRPDASVDQVVIKTIQKGVNCLVKQLGTNDWRVECRLDPKYFPCGGFREDIPIRFLHRGQTIPGGISAFVVGRIVGDIRAEPSAIALGRIAPTGGEARLRLSSASGSDIEVLNIQSSLPEWAKTKILAKGHSWVDIGCRISPPPQLRGKGFSGYYFIRAKSSDLETVKELFYGIITD